jgi:hypothetical protein
MRADERLLWPKALMCIVSFLQLDHTSTQATITVAYNIACSLMGMLILAGTPARMLRDEMALPEKGVHKGVRP